MSGLHADASAVLARWAAPSPAQESLRRRYVAFLAAHPEAMTRAGRPHHLTASVLVLDADHRRVLLTLHAKAGRWFQLGGHAEAGDPTLADAARREAVEESGLRSDQLGLGEAPVLLDEHPVPFCGPGEGVHHLDVVYLATAAPGAHPARSEESLDLRWWPVDGLPDPEIARLVELAQSTPPATSPSSTSPPPTAPPAADQPSR